MKIVTSFIASLLFLILFSMTSCEKCYECERFGSTLSGCEVSLVAESEIKKEVREYEAQGYICTIE